MNKPLTRKLLKDCPFLEKAYPNYDDITGRAREYRLQFVTSFRYIHSRDAAKQALKAMEELADFIENCCADLRSHLDDHKKEKFEYVRER